MEFFKDEKDQQITLQLNGSLTYNNLDDLKEAFVTSFDVHSEIILDLNNITECDTAGIQLLWSARKTAEDKNKNFSIKNASESVKDAALRIGTEI